MNIVMKMMKKKRESLEREYNDLSNLTNDWEEHTSASVYSNYSVTQIEDMLCEFSLSCLVEKELVFLKMRKHDKRDKLVKRLIKIFNDVNQNWLTPKDEFNGAYKK